MCLLNVLLQCWYVCARTCVCVHTHSFSHLCLHNCSQCLHWGSWVSTDKSLAREGPRDTELDIEDVRGSSPRISPQLNYNIWHIVSSPWVYGRNINKLGAALITYQRNSQLELPLMVPLKRCVCGACETSWEMSVLLQWWETFSPWKTFQNNNLDCIACILMWLFNSLLFRKWHRVRRAISSTPFCAKMLPQGGCRVIWRWTVIVHTENRALY